MPKSDLIQLVFGLKNIFALIFIVKYDQDIILTVFVRFIQALLSDRKKGLLWAMCDVRVPTKFRLNIKSHLLHDQAYMIESDDKRETERETDGEFQNMREG